MATRSISIALEANVQGFVSGLRTAQQAARDFGSRTAAFARDNEEHLDRVGKAGMVMGGTILAGIGIAVKSFMEFDSAMSEVRASTHETAANMDMLREAAINAGADTSFSAAEAAKGIDELAKAGVSTKDVLNGGLTGALSLAAAGSLGVGESAEIAATALTQFKLSGKDIPHLADLLAAGAGKAQGSVQDIGAALKQSGLVASQFGLSVEDTTGTLAAFASAGLVGSDSGTALKTMLLKLAAPSKEASALMADLGITAYDASGKFVGITSLAGQLKEKLADSTGATKDMTQATRDSALATIFGTDAIRGANVLYEQGATGISGWIDKVNEAGYAAATATIKQDNLAGDLEKLGGSFDSVLIKGGGGAAEALRGVVQGLEDLVDSVGKIPTPVLNAAVGIGAVTAATLLLGGGLLTLAPKIAAFKASQAALAVSAPRVAGAITGVGKAAGVAAVAMLALVAANAAFGKHNSAPKLEETTQAIMKLSGAAKSGDTSGLDSLFKNWDATILKGAPSDVNNLADAVKRLANKDGWDSFNQGAGELFSMFGGGSAIGQVEDRIKSLGDSMGQLTKNGGADAAAVSFKELTKQFEANGKGAKEALAAVPGYKDALLELANTAKVTVSDEELVAWAGGKVPAAMVAATSATESFKTSAGTVVPISPEVQQSLDDIGISAEGAVVSLDKYAAALVRAGLSNLSVSDAARNSEAAIDAVTDSIATNGTTLDIHTAKGRANQAAFEGVASARMTEVEAMAKATDAYGNNIYSQDQLHSKMSTAYTDLIAAAGQLGITGDAADTMARKALGIPPKVDINAYLHDFASKQLDNVGIKVGNLDGKTANVYTNYHETTIQKVIRELSGGDAPVGAGTVLAPRKKAVGGPVFGPGTGTSDDIPAMLSNGEHVLTAAEVIRMGGHAAVERMRALAKAGLLPKFAAGGAAEKAKARRETWIDYQRDSRRGNGYRSVTESLSNANSFADRLTSLADSGNVSAAAIRNLYTAAGKGEAGLRALHARSDRLSASLEKARDRVTDLSQTRDGIRSNLSGEFSIGDAMKNTNPFKAVTLQGIQGAANSVLARIRTFAGKLNKLRAMGYSGAVLEEIAGLGSEEGMVAADALLKGSKADVKNLNGAYTAIDSASKAAGTYVTDAMYKGGINAANGLVKGLQSQEKAIEKQMLKIGLGMETALKRALGIRSPSKKAEAIGDNFAGTLADRLQAGVSPVAKQAGALGDAMSVVPTAYTPAVTYRPVPISQTGQQQGQMQMTGTLVMDSGEILGVFNGVAHAAIGKADAQAQYTRTGRH